MQPSDKVPSRSLLKHRIHEVIFEAHTPAGRLFDVALFVFIIISVLAVMLESIGPLGRKYYFEFQVIEWTVTVFFTIEYFLRIYCVRRPINYIKSFFGVVDLLAILPAYLSLLFPGTQFLVVIRILRLLRIFRIFKLVDYLSSAYTIIRALQASRFKVQVFLFTIFMIVTIMGAFLYVIEGSFNDGFDSIPRSIYWAIITLTTVGYGDITPITPVGQMLAAVIMILGYSIIAVPTGIVSSEFVRIEKEKMSNEACPNCMVEGHLKGSKYCFACGELLNPPEAELT